MKKMILPFVVTVAGMAALTLTVAQSQSKPRKLIGASQGRAPKTNASKSSVRRTPVAQTHASRVAAHKVPSVIAPSIAKSDISPELRKKVEEHDAPGNQMIKEARALLRANRVAEAEQKCRQAMEYFRENEVSIPRELWGDILLAKGEYEAALQTYSDALFYGDSDLMSIHTSLCYVRLGDLENARQALQACPWADLRKFADDPLPDDLKDMPGTKDLKAMETTLNLVLAIIYSGDSVEALKYLQAAEKLAPESWLIKDRIGDTMYFLKRYDEEVSYYRRAMQLGGDKVSYEHRMHVEMFDLRKKQNKQKAAQ